jgi:putative ABC transport system permease protein
MWRVTIKGLLAHKVRLGLTALAVVLGVGFVAGTYLLTDTMNRAFNDLFAQINRGVAVQVQGVQKFKSSGFGGDAGAPERVPDALVAKIQAVPGVRLAAGSLTGYAQLVDKQGKAISTGGAPTLGVSTIEDPELSGVTLRAGGYPHGSGEIAIDARTASKYGFHVGDTAKVLLEGPPIQARIAGIFGLGSADNLGGATVVAFDPQTAQTTLNGGGKWDTIEVAANQGVSPSTLRDSIQEILPSGFEAKTGAEATQDAADQIKKGLSFFNIALLVFAGISLFVGAFIIFNTFSILIAQRTRELALLRALGASAKQVRRSVVGEATVVGLFASAIGLGFGFLIALGLQGLLKAFGIVLPSTSTQLLPRTIIAAFVVGTLTTLIASVVPAMRASRVPPVAAMRDVVAGEQGSSPRRIAIGGAVTVVGIAALVAGLSGGGASLVGLGAAGVFLGVTILSPLLARPVAGVVGAPFARLGVSGKLGRENAQRNPRRTASTAAALMIGLGLVSFVAIFAASLKASADNALAQILRADYAVFPSSFSSQGFSLDVAQQLRKERAFSGVAEFREGVVGVNGAAQQVVGVDATQLAAVENVTMVQGSLSDLRDGTLLVYRTSAEGNHWHVGQTVTIEFARTGKQQLRIAGIFSDNRGLANYVISLGTYDANFTQHLDGVILLKNAPGVSTAQARAAADRVGKAFPNVKIEDQAQLRQTEAQQVDQLLGLVSSLLGLAILIALFGIINTLALSIYERTHEIGLLRAVGMARRQVRSMVRWEAVIIAVFGALLGTVVGAFFGWAMVQALKDQGIDHLSIPGGQLIVYIVLAGILGVLAAIGPARRAAKLDVLRAITTE